MSDESSAADFDARRGHLRAVALRILGTGDEADDAVQEAWLRVAGTDADAIANLSGWFTTVVARVALDMLRARERRRDLGERYRDHVAVASDVSSPELDAE